MEEICCLLILALLIIMVGMIYIAHIKEGAWGRFHLQKRKSKLNWKKVLEYYIKLQAFILLCKWGNSTLNWWLVFFIPILLIGILVVSFFSYSNGQDKIDESEYQTFKKQYDRDEKLKKVLRRF